MKEKENDRQRYNKATQQEEKRKKALIMFCGAYCLGAIS